MCYVDIDSFKPFNDLYGYACGDEILLCLAHCLGKRTDPSRDFVGHIGGDDFMWVLGSHDWTLRLKRLFDEFQGQCRRFYRAEHLEAGCFVSHNRKGVREEFPLLSLSVGVVDLAAGNGAMLDAQRLAELASHAKPLAKKTLGSSVHVIASGQTDVSRRAR